MRWLKKDISREIIKELHDRFSCDSLTSSILARRGITDGSDILYYMEDDTRYLHNPFLLDNIDDAVEKILDAKEDSAKVLVFGDRDVDGITATTLLVGYLQSMGLDVQWKLPSGNEGYGLAIPAIDDFLDVYGSLIITVDCGISNKDEIAYAIDKGLDVIVIDHHNPPQELPEGAIIINPKLHDSHYPFCDISGCAVVFKVVSALRFSKIDLFNQEICLMNVRPVNEAFVIEAIKTRNLIEIDRIEETIVPGVVSIQQTRLLPFLQGQMIYVWDGVLQQKQLAKIFGSGVEFNFFDIRTEVAKFIPQVENLSLLRIKDMSRIARYSDKTSSELDGFFNIFITFVRMKTAKQFPKDSLIEEHELQLVMLAALADIMPLKNENRILVRKGLDSINRGNICNGLKELLARQNMLGKHICSSDLSWTTIPALNAAGRLGQPELSANLFLSPEANERDALAEKIIELNKERRQLGIDAWIFTEKAGYESLKKYSNNIAAVVDKRIYRGITGILATKLVQNFKVIGIVMTILEDNTVVGSMRSIKGYDVTGILDSCHDLFINAGGHNAAAGFSLKTDNLEEFLSRLEKFSATIELKKESEDEIAQIDAELPHKYITPDLVKIVDQFEPYGEDNSQLTFMASRLKIIAADVIGKPEPKHLKLTLDCGAVKWPALFWNSAELFKVRFDIGDYIDIIFHISRNTFNGTESVQMVLLDAKKSGEISYETS